MRGRSSVPVRAHRTFAVRASVETGSADPCCSWAPTGTSTISGPGSSAPACGGERFASNSGSLGWAPLAPPPADGVRGQPCAFLSFRG